MAKGDNKNTPQAGGTTKSTGSRIDRIRENKALFGVVVLVGLIILAAIGVGAYYAIDSLTSTDGDDDTEEVSDNNDNEDSEDNENEDNQDEDQDENSEDEDSSDDEDADNADEDSSTDNDDEDSSSDSDTNDDNSDNGNNNVTAEATGHSEGGLAKSLSVQNEIAVTGVWRATDYIFGDIVNSSYMVQLGDTLWEIADGYYGNAYRWIDISNNNSSVVDVLPSGERALIYPGTTLNLP